jgi:hypothetical protein
MAKYIQRIALLGKERWIGWEIDGVGTEVAGLMLADGLSPEELRARGIKEFHPLDFETFLGMNPDAGKPAAALLDQDIDFRLDALQVGMERIRSRGETAVPRNVLTHIFGSEEQLEHPRVQKRLLEWALSGAVELVRDDDCYLRIVGPF